MTSALMIFVRKPVLGKVKTRIAADTGNEAALAIYQKLQQHTARIVEPLTVAKYAFYADEINREDELEKDFIKRAQKGNDLGARMQNAFQEVFAQGHRSVCIIGSDCYELTTAIIEQAFVLLESHQVVVGPAKDGGYYLLAMKEKTYPLFDGVEWSTEKVLQQTINHLNAHQLSYALLPVLSDVDTVKDVPLEWKKELGLVE